PAPASPAGIEVVLSAETRAEVDVGASARVPFQIELAGEAMPLAVSQPARARQDLPIVVSISAENDAVAIVRAHEYSVEPPAPGQPRTGFFTVKGVRPGVARLAVAFRQGGSELGVIGLVLEVLQAGAGTAPARGQATAAPRDVADDDKLALLVEQRVEGGQVFYEYTLHSEALGLPYRRVRSKPLLDRGGGAAATALAFVERIYERVTRELKSRDDLQQLQREARALGASLCQELFDPEVARLLWPLRERIRLVQIVSWEPYIPWELVRLRDPESDEIDDRFLCEYGLVRTLSDDMPPKALPMGRWAYLGAAFPMGSFPPVGAELDYFTRTSPESLRARGITPEAIAATRDAFYDALAEGDFDVLHISCHAESPHQSIERASLIIGDETPPGDSKARLVEVDTITVEAEARLRPRRPLVFLNACETGRVGAVLTAWGGWPNVFLRKGAGAFVGAAWAVRDKPAAVFSSAFYNALLDGRNLAEAASAARAAAKQLGDASWLAFKVYGHPRARRSGA
ncbi:MAG TPA: CHAT domain-containing protein, partial [Pelomicrobium sp.]|nr:CHAT domain-containing protein [Pelomicrobium sp.]